jgi:hypothetical protein
MMFTADVALALTSTSWRRAALGLAQAAPAVAAHELNWNVMPANLKRRVRAVDETVTLDLSGAVTLKTMLRWPL